MNTLSFRGQVSRPVCGIICLTLFLALQLFASSEALHKLIHPDAHAADHHCAITLFSQGHVSPPEAGLSLAAFAAALLFLLLPLQAAVFSSFDYRFSSSRAPPAV